MLSGDETQPVLKEVYFAGYGTWWGKSSTRSGVIPNGLSTVLKQF